MNGNILGNGNGNGNSNGNSKGKITEAYKVGLMEEKIVRLLTRGI